MSAQLGAFLAFCYSLIRLPHNAEKQTHIQIQIQVQTQTQIQMQRDEDWSEAPIGGISGILLITKTNKNKNAEC